MTGTARSGGDRKTKYDDNFPGGIPSKPGDLSAEEGELWDQFLDQIPETVLRSIDWVQLKFLCELLYRERRYAKACRDDPLDFKANRAHLAVIQEVGKLSRHYGLSPVDRQKIKSPPKKKASQMDDWMNDS